MTDYQAEQDMEMEALEAILMEEMTSAFGPAVSVLICVFRQVYNWNLDYTGNIET